MRHLAPGTTLAGQGEPEDELFLLLDGILTAEVDGRALAELGPGSILGERALFARGTRTATLRAKTSCRVAVVHVHDLQEYVLAN
ncbi:MAG TPA: cyclic nucleotide-binding domain-containing protein [Chloroflexota bacterium]|nr:cyclic nucleotide-binding domain-containing protein [Chloroflexota bacterium]